MKTVFFTALMLATVPLMAAEPYPMPMHGGGAYGMPMHADNGQAMSPVHRAYADSMQAMHADMMRGVSAQDPDTAFAAGMLPHHQGAVKMAQIELQYGKDPVMRKLAENIIKAQEREIKLMQEWLAKHPQR